MKGVSIAVLIAGAGLLAGGLVVRGFQAALAQWGDAAMVAGGLLLVAFLWIERLELKRLASGRQVKYGANSVVYSLVVAAIVGGVNYVGSRHVKRLDLTEDKLYTLSEQSRNVLEKLPRDVTVTGFFREGAENRTRARDILTLFERASDRIKVEMVDPDQDPRRAEQLDIRQDETTVFQSGEQKSVVTSISEETFANAIGKVVSDDRPKVYFVEGHGEIPIDGPAERGLGAAREQLVQKSYEVAKLNLANVAEVPRDASLVVIADPEQALGERGEATLDRYLKEGGRAMLLLEPRRADDLAPLLARYGVDLQPDIVIDPTMRMLGGPAEAVMVTPEMLRVHPITKRFPFNVYLLMARSVAPLSEPPDGFAVQSLMECSAAGWAETGLDQPTVRFDADKDRRGPVPLAVAVTWKAQADPAPGAAPAAAAASPTPTPADTAATPAADAAPTPTDAPAQPSPDPSPAPSALSPTPEATAQTPSTDATPTPGATPPTTLELSSEPAWPKEGATEPAAAARRRFDEGRLVVVGDASFASDTILPDTATGNAPLFVNMVSWLGDTEELIGAPPRKPRSYSVRISNIQGFVLTLLVLFGLPGAIFLYGATVWWRRRRL